jgi:Flp pilus assembly pilin Flp
MSTQLQKLQRLAHDTRGAGFVEYIILIGVVALACIAGYRAFGTKVADKIQAQGTEVSGIK